MRRELQALIGDKEALTYYLDGLGKLLNSGVLTALRALGRPSRYELGADVNKMASEAAWSAGWNDCLDSLLHFKELYLEENQSAEGAQINFGSLDLALERKEITKDEADAIRTGEPVKYEPKQFANSITIPTRPAKDT